MSSSGRFGAFAVIGVLVAGTSFAGLGEVRLLTLRRWGWVVTRVAALVVARLLLLPFDPTSDPATWLYLLAVGAPALSGFVAVTGLLRPRRSLRKSRPKRTVGYLRFATTNWWVLVATQGLAFAVPAVVSLRVTDDEFASFYVVWSVAAIIFLIPQMIGQVLLTEGSKRGAGVADQGLQALLAAVGFAVLATAAATIGRGTVSLIYGAAYADGESLLPILCAASIPWAVTTTTISLLRIRRLELALALLALAFASVTLPLAFVMTGRLGISGGAWAWFIGHSVGACLAAGPLVRLLRSRDLSRDDIGLGSEPVARAARERSEQERETPRLSPPPSASAGPSELSDHEYAVPAQDLP